MLDKFPFKFFLKLFLSTIVIGIALSIGSYFFISPVIEKIVNKNLHKSLIGKYNYSYSKFNFNILRRSVSISDFNLTPVTNLQNDTNPQRNNYTIKLKRIRVIGIGVIDLYYKKLNIGTVVIETPEISINNTISETASSSEKFNLYDLLKNTLVSVKISKVLLKDGKLTIIKNGAVNSNNFSLNNFNMELKNIALNESIANKNFGWPEWKSMDVSSKNNHYLLPDRIHTLDIPNIAWSDRDCVTVVMDTRLVEKSTVNESRIDIRIPLLKADKSDWKSLLQGKINVGCISVFDPNVSIAVVKSQNSKQRVQKNIDLNRIIIENFPETKINEIKFINGNIAIAHVVNEWKLYFYGVSTSYKNLKINIPGIANQALDKPVTSFTIAKVRSVFADSTYVLEGKNASISESNDFKIESFKLIPQYDKVEYAKLMKTQTERFEIELKNVQISNLDIPSALFGKKIIANNITIDQSKIFAYRDKRFPSIAGYKNLPTVALRNSSTYINIKYIMVKNTDIVYQERLPKSKTESEISFNRLNVFITNCSNDLNLTKFPMEVAASGYFLNQTKINSKIKFNLRSAFGDFTMVGKSGKLNLATMNNLIKNSAKMYIKQGVSDSMSFAFKGNDTLAKGEMNFYYQGLKIDLINKKHEQKKGLKSHVGTFLMDKLLIKTNNPERNQETRVGEIYFKRIRTKSIFNFMAKSVLSGCISSVAPVVPDLKNARVQNTNDK